MRSFRYCDATDDVYTQDRVAHAFIKRRKLAFLLRPLTYRIYDSPHVGT